MEKNQEVKQAKAPAYKLIQGAEAINKEIQLISGAGKKFEQRLHIAALSCLHHAGAHNDVTLAQKLVEALPGLARKNALRDWFLAFGNIRYDEEKRVLRHASGKSVNETQAAATPFWEFKPEAEYVPFDLQAAIRKVYERATAAKAKGDKLPESLMAQLSDLVTGGKPTTEQTEKRQKPEKVQKAPKKAKVQKDPLAA